MELASPGLPGFDYLRVDTFAEVTEHLLQHNGDARLLMGGTDILVRMRDGALSPKILLDLKHLPGLTTIEFDPVAGLRIGAAVNMNAMARHAAVLAHYPLLAEAANSVASYQLRTRATMGGNLCNASPAADTAPAALVLDATLVTWGVDGERMIPSQDFFVSPGKNALHPGEFVTRIDFPLPPVGWNGCYRKLGRNAEGDLAIVGVAAMGYPDVTLSSGYRFQIGLASVAPTPVLVPKVEQILAQSAVTDALIEAAAKATQEASRPIDDLRASAHYRKKMVYVLARRALQDVWGKLPKENN
jgi:CO/xanthine dehydrogenase FAD-binding subunit